MAVCSDEIKNETWGKLLKKKNKRGSSPGCKTESPDPQKMIVSGKNWQKTVRIKNKIK